MAVRLARATALLLITSVAAFALYGPTLHYGFHYDDYEFVRPYTLDEVLETFRGSWDHSGIMVPFYRPLTIALHAARFELFGLNAVAHHTLSLALFAVAGALAGAFAARLTGSFRVGALAAVVYMVHPAMPYAQAAWITNQMHLLSSLCVFVGLVWWTIAARRGLVWWIPLLPIAAAAFLIKEDNVMFLPAVVVLHWLRRRLGDPSLPRVPRTFLGSAAILIVGLFLVRREALGGLGGYGQPSPELAWVNFYKGLRGVFWLQPPHRPWQPFASWFAMLVPPFAFGCWRWVSCGNRVLMAAGLSIGLLFNVPFVLVSKGEQMHLVAAGASLVVAGSVAALLEASRGQLLRGVAATVTLAGLGAFAYVGRHISTDFRPYGPIVLAMDRIVQEWAAVPHELRDYLQRKAETAGSVRPSSNPADDLTTVVFGVHSLEHSSDGLPYQWMSQSRTEILVTGKARTITIPVRHEAGAFRESARVSVHIDGRHVDQLTLADSDWRALRYAFHQQSPRLFRMHRVTVEIPHAWIPQKLIPHSADGRVLGLQVGKIVVR